MGTLPQEQVALLSDYDINSAYRSAYYALYTNLGFDWDSQKHQQYTILLATPAEYVGHAAAAANLAIVAAQNGTPTILVDADLQKPTLQQRFALGEHSGLKDLLLQDRITTQNVLPHLRPTFLPDLSLLGAGSAPLQTQEIHRLLTTNLREVIASLRQILATKAQRPGLIIFNSAPILSTIDTVLLSSMVDQTLLIIATGHTTRSQAKRAQVQLERAHAKLAGAIMLEV